MIRTISFQIIHNHAYLIKHAAYCIIKSYIAELLYVFNYIFDHFLSSSACHTLLLDCDYMK